MPSKMATFLLDVAENNELLAAFKKDPEKVMNDAGLSEEEKNSIKKQDIKRIQELAFVAKPSEGEKGLRIVFIITLEHDWVNVYSTDLD
jgi:hypothetical protein